MKTLNTYLLCLVLSCMAALSFTACESEPYEITGKPNMDDFQIACEAAQGEYVALDGDYRCQCGETICDAGVVCSFEDIKNPACPMYIPDSCVAGTTMCSNGKSFTCKADGTYAEGVACEKNLCADATSCADCVDKGVCADGMFQKCEGHKLLTATPCKTGVCNAEGTECGEVCTLHDTKCEQDTLYYCSKNKTSELNERAKKNECPSGCTEDGLECAPSCVPGTIKCEDNEDGIGYTRTCDTEGFYTKAKACNDNASCQSATECGECTNGPVSCTDDPNTLAGSAVVCAKGKLASPKTCANNYSCDNNSCGQCNNLTPASCENDTNGLGTRTYCKDGIPVSLACADNAVEATKPQFSCALESGELDALCGKCVNGDVKCFEDTESGTLVSRLKTCTKGAWETLEECSACSDDKKSCKK